MPNNPDAFRHVKLALLFAVMAALWLAIGLWGYRKEVVMVHLAEDATMQSEPEQWAEMSRQSVTDPDAPRWGMDFLPSLLPLDSIIHGGPGKDGVPALTQPNYVSVDGAYFLQPDDRVIGVTLDGQSRAWPLSILQYHEIVNDSLSGHPLVVTGNPISGTALVFSGLINGEVRTFGTSGLFYQSAPLIYDRQPMPHAESLWSPMLLRAVCGPAVAEGLRLELIDADLMSWSGWVQLHPETTVISMETGYEKSYHIPSEGRYLSNDYLMMPAELSGRRPDLKNKDDVMILQVGQTLKAYPIADLRAQKDGRILDEVDGHRFTLALDATSGRVTVQSDSEPDLPLTRGYSYWFAWDASHPGGVIYSGPGQKGRVNSGFDQPLQ